jgi:hypothetical protein
MQSDEDPEIRRPPEDLQSGVLVVITDDEGDQYVVDAEEYQLMYNDNEIRFPKKSAQTGQTLDEAFPGYSPDANNVCVVNNNNTILPVLGQFGVRP